MSLLTVVQGFCQRTGLPVPSFVIGTTDSQIVQITALANEVVEDLCDRWTWTDLMREATFVTVAGEDQGSLDTIAPNGFLRISQETIFNRTLRLPLFGPMTQAQWQALKALPTTGPFYKYRIRQNRILFMPAGIAGHTCAFEYATSFAVVAADGTTYRSAFAADTDTFVLEERLLLAGLRWKWKAEKGLDYAEEFRRYEEMANNASGRDGTKPRIDMSGGGNNFHPGIWAPSGNWNVSSS
jgi:hypothetical protein